MSEKPIEQQEPPEYLGQEYGDVLVWASTVEGAYRREGAMAFNVAEARETLVQYEAKLRELQQERIAAQVQLHQAVQKCAGLPTP